MTVPDFLIIGGMKAGTVSLYSALETHPEINLSLVREPNFFALEDDAHGSWDLGLPWYRSLFPSSPGLKGEASTAYTKFPRVLGVPARIHRTNPDCRLIYLIRNPMDRAISHYLHKVLGGQETKPIQAALMTAGNQFLVTSMYYMQIQQFHEYFAREQMLVIVCEEMWRNPKGSLDQVCDFLQIDALPLLSDQFPKRNTTIARALRHVSHDSGNPAPSNPAYEELRSAIRSGSLAHDGSAQSIGAALGVDSQFRGRLAARFIDDYASLCRYLRHSIADWDEEFRVSSPSPTGMGNGGSIGCPSRS